MRRIWSATDADVGLRPPRPSCVIVARLTCRPGRIRRGAKLPEQSVFMRVIDILSQRLRVWRVATFVFAGAALAPHDAFAAQAHWGASGSILAVSVAAGASSKDARDEARDETRTSRRRARRRVARRTSSSVGAASALGYTSPRGTGALVSDLGTMLSSRVRSGQWGVLVVSLTRGDTLYSVNPDAALQPASNMKLYTTALALDQFGADHEFSTDILRDGTITPDGTLHGNLIIRGDGDPSLSSRFLEGGAGAAVDSLAQLVSSAGIRRVSGALVADASAFDTQRIPEGWQSRYLQAGYAARVSALSLNENLVIVAVRPGSRGAATVWLEPNTDLQVVSNVRTVAGRGARIMTRTTADGTIEVRGWIGARSEERRYQLVVEDPTAFAAGALRRSLEAHGIKVDGPTQFATTPKSAVRVASLASPPLARLLAVMNRESINHYAELLFRDAGRQGAPNQVGSVETAGRLLHSFMTDKVGAAPGAVVAADGSGLSVLDHVTPRSLVQLLGYAHRAPWSDAFHASLPVAGESELLRYRMRYTPAQGNLHAKTGTTNSVISLGGYVTARDGELLAFAFIYNGVDRWNAKSTIDAMGATLASFVRN
jgi:serine-type D-Ala-D-Ala carboxypeptidase/endopeptidase (penicillin-binding protein 4)